MPISTSNFFSIRCKTFSTRASLKILYSVPFINSEIFKTGYASFTSVFSIYNKLLFGWAVKL